MYVQCVHVCILGCENAMLCIWKFLCNHDKYVHLEKKKNLTNLSITFCLNFLAAYSFTASSYYNGFIILL